MNELRSKTPTNVAGEPRPDLPEPDPRLERIRQFQFEALACPNALASNLAMINSDLMLFAYRQGQTLEQTLSDPVQRTRDGVRQMETYLKTVRQIDRLAQLDSHLRQPVTKASPIDAVALPNEKSAI